MKEVIAPVVKGRDFTEQSAKLSANSVRTRCTRDVRHASGEPRSPIHGEGMRESIQSEPSLAGRDYTDEEIRSFVRDLESLRSGDLTVALLVGCGERAIPALREFLLHGQPRAVFQPRQHAVEALAELGAKDVLIEYLSQNREIPNAVVRFAEEAVANTAARELARWPTKETFQFLLNFAQARTLPGVIDALGKSQRAEAASVFLRALTDDVCRPFAEEALRSIAEKVRPALIQAAQPNGDEDVERPREKQKRRSVLRILADMVVTEAECIELTPLLQDHDQEIAIMAGEIGVDWAPAEERQHAARFLIRSLASTHWYMQIRIQDCLRRNYVALREVIDSEVKIRRRAPFEEQVRDHALRILEKLQSSIT